MPAIGRKPAYPKRFDNHCVILVRQRIQYPPVHPRNYLQKQNTLIHSVVKPYLFRETEIILYIKDNSFLLNHRYIRIINAGKCIVAFRPLLFPASPGDNLSVKDDIYAVSPVAAGEAEAV